MADPTRNRDIDKPRVFATGPFVDGRRPTGTLRAIVDGLKKVARSLSRPAPQNRPPPDVRGGEEPSVAATEDPQQARDVAPRAARTSGATEP